MKVAYSLQFRDCLHLISPQFWRRSLPPLLFRSLVISTGVAAFLTLAMVAGFILLAISTSAPEAKIAIQTLEHLLGSWIIGLCWCLTIALIVVVCTSITYSRAALEIDLAGLTITCLTGKNAIPWKRVKEISDDSRYIYFWLRPAGIYLLPKRYLGNGAGALQFIQTANGCRSGQGEPQANLSSPGVWPPAPSQKPPQE